MSPENQLTDVPFPENRLAGFPSSLENQLAGISSSTDYNLEFRAYNDDAWYSVGVLLEGQILRIKYQNFPDDHDNVFDATKFGSLKQVEEFGDRFRPLSKQVQDNECRKLVQGMTVCACHCFSDDDVRFYDAIVDGVQQNKHSFKIEEELCLCTFTLFWLHGPNTGNLTTATIENICKVQPTSKLDPLVASFLKMAKERIKFISCGSLSMSKGVAGWEMVAYRNEDSNTACRLGPLGYFERLRKETQCAKRSAIKVCSSVSCHNRRMEDSDLGGKKNQCMILIGNLDKELHPSTIAGFLHRETSILPRVYIFPRLSSEIYTRGAIALDSEKDFQKLCDFLNNPNCIIISSTGRPWVIIEKLVGLKNIKASIGTLMPISKNESSETSNNLKVVYSGTEEFKIASDLRDLFLAFNDHQVRLYKRLAREEERIFCS